MADQTIRDRLRGLPSLAGPLPEFDPAGSAETPQEQFLGWLDEAIEHGVREPHAMVLSTTDPGGRADARVLILKDLDEQGWHFAISRHSRKGAQLAAQDSVALTFYWPALARQVRVRGRATDLGPAAATADFDARSAGARAHAMAGCQSDPIEENEALPVPRDLYADARSVGWAVFAVRPVSVEFWQGREDRAHIRLRYEPTDGEWTKVRLRP